MKSRTRMAPWRRATISTNLREARHGCAEHRRICRISLRNEPPARCCGLQRRVRELKSTARDEKSLSRHQLIKQVATAELPTKWGHFRAIGFERPTKGHLETAVALIMGDISAGAPLVRIHSQCLTGDVFGSLRCDCGEQLNRAMEAIAEEGAGILIYEKQEGPGHWADGEAPGLRVAGPGAGYRRGK